MVLLLSNILHILAGDEIEREKYLKNPDAYAAAVNGLTAEERRALVTLDQSEMIALGLHPFVSHSFRRVLERSGVLEADSPDKQ